MYAFANKITKQEQERYHGTISEKLTYLACNQNMSRINELFVTVNKFHMVSFWSIIVPEG